MEFRSYREEDKDRIIRLIDAIYREYGDRVHLGGSEADLNDIPAHFASGHFMVLDDGTDVVATVGISPDRARTNVCWLKRLYLNPVLRGTGEGARLLQWVVDTAQALEKTRIELWSDVRFERAHAFYRKHGFQREGVVRTMTDGWAPYDEYFFFRDLA